MIATEQLFIPSPHVWGKNGALALGATVLVTLVKALLHPNKLENLRPAMQTLDLTLVEETLGLQKLPTVNEVRRRENCYALNEQGKLAAVSISRQGPALSALRIGATKSLEHLYLAHNEYLQHLEINSKLPELTHAYLNNNKIENLEWPEGCAKLQQLYLAQNGLKTMHFLGDCPALTILDLGENELAELDLTAGFAQLSCLYLRNNGLKQLLLPASLPQLNILSAAGNQLQDFPLELVDSKTLENLILQGSAPKSIPRDFLGTDKPDNCLAEARIWYEELRPPAQTAPNAYVKLMLLGNGNAGKSSLVEAFQKGHCPKGFETTQGINIGVIDKPDYKAKFNFWDFGGQEIYHSTHRLFLSSPALQVLVFDSENEDLAIRKQWIPDRSNPDRLVRNQILEYWYDTSRELSPHSRFVLAQNKIDLLPHAVPTVDELVRRYQLFIPWAVSAYTGQGVEDLFDRLQREAKELPEMGMVMPESWLKVRDFFIKVQSGKIQGKELISEADYQDLCEKEGVKPYARALLKSHLHHNGFLYQHERLGEQIIANQQWALEAIYKLTDRSKEHYEDLRGRNGKIQAREIFAIFGDAYTVDQKWLFLDFMRSCQLCFRTNDDRFSEERAENALYVFPEFLPENAADFVELYWENASLPKVHFRLPLRYAKRAELQGFIAELGRKTDLNNIWRNGISVAIGKKGSFKVELEEPEDEDQSYLHLLIEERIMDEWFKPIREALGNWISREGWQINTERGFETIEFEAWLAGREKGAKEKARPEREIMQEHGEAKSIPKDLEDVVQRVSSVLILSANPDNTPGQVGRRLSIGDEVEAIFSKLSEKELQNRFEKNAKRKVSPVGINEAIDDKAPHVVHFICHGDEEGNLYLEGENRSFEKVSPETWARVFKFVCKAHPQLVLVFFNACFSHLAAQSISGCGVFAIGTNDEVSSLQAEAFAQGFYRKFAELQQKQSVDETEQMKQAFRSGMALAAYKNAKEDLFNLYHQGNKINME
jgi:GTPase SAR1 family protein